MKRRRLLAAETAEDTAALRAEQAQLWAEVARMRAEVALAAEELRKFSASLQEATT